MNETDEIELKPCPFCGGAEVKMQESPRNDFWAWCESCGAQTYGSSDKAKTVAAWNRRAPPLNEGKGEA